MSIIGQVPHTALVKTVEISKIDAHILSYAYGLYKEGVMIKTNVYNYSIVA